ncbi:isopentenyl-diphosphate Delta-isomerase [Janibacter sp. RAF20_2_2]|uniref:isopentenyl-diphosphate Delta-isomerase n=1 Tax=unclassified Janibacter TaxID=2649294 RepID=UPI003F93C83B
MSTADEDPADLVVLLADDARPVGTAPRADVHTDRTPLHLAFSCHVTDGSGRLLLTRRALNKRTWPGVWTNAFCGHPRPGEDPQVAVHRYAEYELGLRLDHLEALLPDFRYRAVDASGTVEHEVCPVWLAHTTSDPSLNRDEAVEARWVTPQELRTTAEVAPWALSPWLVLQLDELPAGRSALDQVGLAV